MKRWTKINNKAFTIIEVLIVLAVTGTMLIAAIVAIGGRQARVEFQQAARDIEHRTQSTMNDAATGLFAVPENFGCRVTASGHILQITSGGITSGQCMFIGKALQFEPADAPGTINEINIMGARLNAAGEQVSNLDEAQPRTRSPILFANKPLLYGLRAERMFYTHEGTTREIGAVAFIARLSGGGQGSQIDLYPLAGTGLQSNNSNAAVVSAVRDLNESSLKNPSDGFTVCFEGGVGNQIAVMRFGGALATPTLVIGGGTCAGL